VAGHAHARDGHRRLQRGVGQVGELAGDVVEQRQRILGGEVPGGDPDELAPVRVPQLVSRTYSLGTHGVEECGRDAGRRTPGRIGSECLEILRASYELARELRGTTQHGQCPPGEPLIADQRVYE